VRFKTKQKKSVCQGDKKNDTISRYKNKSCAILILKKIYLFLRMGMPFLLGKKERKKA